MKRAIIIGATSGIGRELAKVLANNDYSLGLTGRRVELLAELQQELPTETFIKGFDISIVDQAMTQLEELIHEMNGVDLIIINAGCGFENPKLDFDKERITTEVNALGFIAMINVAYKYFSKVGRGHIVGISSIAALRGSYESPAYSASKAFISNYMEGLRVRSKKERLPLIVTDIKPGFVDTAMALGEGLFWVAPPAKAAIQIYQVIKARKAHAYITKRWCLIAWLLKVMPNWLYQRI